MVLYSVVRTYFSSTLDGVEISAIYMYEVDSVGCLLILKIEDSHVLSKNGGF